MSDYDFVNTSKLKLNTDAKIKKKKHKKKHKDKKQKKLKEIAEELVAGGSKSEEALQQFAAADIDNRTKAEIQFADTKAKRVGVEMLKKAAKTHKERIMDFNEHLDNLSEHYDIPKVSWTK